MLNAISKYYENLKKIYKKNFNSLPTVSFVEDEDIDNDLYLSSPNEDGEVEWGLKKIENLDFLKIEEELGFKINSNLKEYFSSYLFLSLNGRYNEIDFSFDSLKSVNYIKEKILISSKDGKYYFPDNNYFLIGIATYKQDDGYMIFYDNDSSKIFIYEDDTKKTVDINISLASLIENLEPNF